MCIDSNPARGISEICDGEYLWQWSRPEIRFIIPRRSTIPRKQFNSSAVVVPSGVPLNTVPLKTIFIHYLQNYACVGYDIFCLLFLRDSHDIFLILSNQMKIFIQCFITCFPLFYSNLYFVYSSWSNIRKFFLSLYLIFIPITFL